ncbi:hypothetical protein D3C75_956330 [compost metagenome]|jgi:hypothetical protein
MAANCRFCGKAHDSGLDAWSPSHWCRYCGMPLAWSDDPSRYIPNHVTLGSRITSLVFSLPLAIYILHGLIVGELWLPFGRRADIDTWHFTGFGTWTASAWLSLWLAGGVLPWLDHIDKRPNERRYRQVADNLPVAIYASWPLVMLFGTNISL